MGRNSSYNNGLNGNRAPRLLPLLLVALFILRWWLGTLEGYAPDLTAYKQWALVAGTEGIHTVFDRSSYDYPPLYAYLLAPIGQLYAWLAPGAVAEFSRTRFFGDSALFSLLIKLPPLAFDILIAFLLGTLALRFGVWSRISNRGGWLPALVYLFLPPVLFDSGYWGQPDAVHTFSIFLGLTLILVGKPELGWVAAALACMMKPLAVPFLPLLALATLVRSGWRRLFTGGLAALATCGLLLLPFLLSGRGGLVYQQLFQDLDLMAFTSVNGHNLWWLIAPWQPADKPWLGPLTPTHVGLALLGIAYVLILAGIWRAERSQLGHGSIIARGSQPLSCQQHWYIAGAAVAFAFFMFSTHMHENHLFSSLPFLVLIAGMGGRWLTLCLLASIGMLINMVFHDLTLGETLLQHVGGPSSFFHPDIHRYLSRFEWTVINVNSAFLFVLTLLLFYWGKTFRPLPAPPRVDLDA
ncbi:MAG: hypothetical protein V1774_10730 [Candidatus Eisenbacteria bacterium]